MRRCPGIAHQCDRMVAELSDDGIALAPARMIVVTAHRCFCTDMLKKLGGDARVFSEDSVGAAKCFGGARAEIPEIADRGRDDV